MTDFAKMLRAPGAEWIQERWKPKVGDETNEGVIVGYDQPRKMFYLNFNQPINEFLFYKMQLIWLPTIEDLLGMVEGNLHTQRAQFFLFTACIHGSEEAKYIWSFTTWSELILAFVQWEVKGLKWTGKEWF